MWGAGDQDVVNDVNMLGQSPLHVTATSNDVESAKLLLDAGSSVHTLDSAGFSPAHVAARWGNAEILQLLLSRGADLKRKTKRGQTLIEVRVFLSPQYVHHLSNVHTQKCRFVKSIDIVRLFKM